MLRLRQRFAISPPLDVRRVLTREFAKVSSQVTPGARVAVAVGSRGIAHLDVIAETVLDWLKAAGARPFVVPAMGSHGGATPEGQKSILAGYGLTESRLGVPIHAGMEVRSLGLTEDGLEVFFSAEALAADGILLVNRVKPHTDFASDSLGSGLLKMLVVGLGKHQGAAHFHAQSVRLGEERFIRAQARVILNAAPVIGGIAIVEDQRHEPVRLAVLRAGEFESGEPGLFADAKRLMPRLPFDDIDLLIVDRIGKNISGTGMDPAVIGRSVHGYSAQLSQVRPPRPYVRRLFVRDLTPESHGNGNGIGMADFTTTRLVRSLDYRATYQNVLTSLSLNNAKIPLHFPTDREVITHALNTLARPDTGEATVVRIRDTLSLEYLEASEACTPQIATNPAVETLTTPAAMAFGSDHDLLPLDG